MKTPAISMSLSASPIALLVGMVALVLAACTGSADSDSDSDSDSESVAPTSAALAAPTPTATIAPAVTAEEPPPAATTTTPLTDAGTDQIFSAVGAVIAVDGNLVGIDSFTMRLDDGTDRAFVPDPDALFDHGPFSHIRDHLASGVPVRVDYLALEDGSNVALGAGDA